MRHCFYAIILLKCFRDATDYYQSFFKTLYQLRQDASFCDIKLQVETETFMAHKIVLMSGSAYFHAMFASEMSEHDKGVVTIGGVSARIFQALLDFIYSGTLGLGEQIHLQGRSLWHRLFTDSFLQEESP